MKKVKKGSFLIETLMAIALISIVVIMLLPSLISLMDQQLYIVNKYKMMHLAETAMEETIGNIYAKGSGKSYSREVEGFNIRVEVTDESELEKIKVTVNSKDDNNESISFQSFIKAKGLYTN